MTPRPFLAATKIWISIGLVAIGNWNTRADQPKLVQSTSLGATNVSVTLIENEDNAEFSLTTEPTSVLTDWIKATEQSDPSKWMRVQVEDQHSSIPEGTTGSASERPSILGTYMLEPEKVIFQSRFALNPRVRYVVSLRDPRQPAEKSATVKLIFNPAERRKSTHAASTKEKVLAVYPSNDRLPENLLKFYIHFSTPMSRGEAYQRIHLMHGEEEVADPFLELGEELWDHEQTRFTLFVHPGRIKRGVKPREDDGLPMTAGNSYKLVIDSQWKTADREPLAESFIKTFQVVAADDQQPSPEKWKIETPKAQTTDTVRLIFNEALDHAMLQRVLVVRDIKGQAVEGHIQVSERETQWEFQPEKPWTPGTYAIEIETNLEDVCGNSLARPFETALQTVTDAIETPRMIAVEFTVN